MEKAKYMRDSSTVVQRFREAGLKITPQRLSIFNLMKDAHWRTLGAIADATGAPQASISAQLRHMRKDRFGEHTVDKKRVGERGNGLWAYRLLVNNG